MAYRAISIGKKLIRKKMFLQCSKNVLIELYKFGAKTPPPPPSTSTLAKQFLQHQITRFCLLTIRKKIQKT